MIVCRPFVFLRHGSTEWTDNSILMGQEDVPLNAQGRAQIRTALDSLRLLNFAMIVHSPLQRCAESVAILNHALQIPSFAHEGLCEANMGSFQGKPKADAASFQAWRDAKGMQGGETFQAFQERVMKSIQDIFTITQKGLILIVSHGGVFEAIRESFQIPPFYLKCATPVLMVPSHETIALHKQNSSNLHHIRARL